MAKFVSKERTFAKSARSYIDVLCKGLVRTGSGPLQLPSWPFRSIMGILLGMAEMVVLEEMAGTMALIGMAEVVGVASKVGVRGK